MSSGSRRGEVQSRSRNAVTGPTRASVVTYIFPIVGLLLGLIILSEPLDFGLLAGSGLIVAGIGVLNVHLPTRRPQPGSAAAD